VRPGEVFPHDQAYIEFTDAFIESIIDLTQRQKVEVLAEIVALCDGPAGSHTLSNRGAQRLAGFNTVDVLGKAYRVVFVSVVEHVGGQEVGHIRVLVCGPRRNDAVYDTAEALRRSGRFSAEEMQEIWEALAFLEVVSEEVGMDGWDFKPNPAPLGMVRAAVAAGVLDQETAEVLSQDELAAAMAHGWTDSAPDPAKARAAAMERARGGVLGADLTRILGQRKSARCGAVMQRTGQPCIRRQGHPGAHRAT